MSPLSSSKNTISTRSSHFCSQPRRNAAFGCQSAWSTAKQAFATLSQLRNIDSKRLVMKIMHIEQNALDAITAVTRLPS